MDCRGAFAQMRFRKREKEIHYSKDESSLPLSHPAIEVLRLLEAGSAVVDGERVPDDIVVPSRRVIPQAAPPSSTESISRITTLI